MENDKSTINKELDHIRDSINKKNETQSDDDNFILLDKILSKGKKYDKKTKIEKSVKQILKEEEKFGIKKFETYKKFGEKVYKVRENVRINIKKLKL